MTDFINKFKIPTLLGMGIIFLGITGGVYLVLREQAFISQAAPNLTPRDITITNITDNSAVISWQTNSAAPSFVSFGQNNPGEQTALDDRDLNAPKPHLTHYVTLKNLLSKTSYQFKINSGKITSEIEKFETATPVTNQTGFTPIIGSILDGDSPLEDGFVYLSLPDAAIQSSAVKTGGNFLIPLSEIRKADLSDIYPLTEGAIAKLTIRSDKGETEILFRLKTTSNTLPPIKLGQNIDLTTDIPNSPVSSITDLNKYDLNQDGKINVADNTTILQNLGKNPKNKKADINEDGIVDQQDRNVMTQKLKDLGVE